MVLFNNGLIVQYGTTHLTDGHNYTTFPTSFTSTNFVVSYEHYWENGNKNAIMIAKTTLKELGRIFTQTLHVTSESSKVSIPDWDVDFYFIVIGY